MPRTIAEADWKVLRRVHRLALERYCERVLAEIERVTHNSAQSSHQRYLDIFKIIEQRNREMASIFDDPKRSNALTMLALMRSDGLRARCTPAALTEILSLHGQQSFIVDG
jgi:hypothetical protein